MNKIIINNETKYRQVKFIKGLLKYALKELNIKHVEVSVVLIDEPRMKALNSHYRGLDKITDVLAFSFETKSNLGYNKGVILGDIYLCIPQMLSQAAKYGHSPKRELAFLALHGLLHLIGYDHDNASNEKEMLEVKEAILYGKGYHRT